MKYMFSLLLSFLLLSLSCVPLPSYTEYTYEAVAQGGHRLTIPELKLSLELPAAWSSRPNIHEQERLVMYHFRRDAIWDRNGRKIIPNLGLFIEDIPEDLDAIEYAFSLRMRESFRQFTDVVYKPGFFGEVGGVAHIARYIDPEQLKHRIVFFCTVQEKKGVKILIDGTESVFDDLKDEYDAILQSLKQVPD